VKTTNGSSWTTLGNVTYLGSASGVKSMAVFDDGNGPALYAGGTFTSIGGVPAKDIAKWQEGAWTSLGTGIFGPSGGVVYALASHDDRSGQALYVGGSFTTAGGLPASAIAKWQGGEWTSLGSLDWATPVWVGALRVFCDGNGSALYAGGQFGRVDGMPSLNIARWGCQP
jgi:hypothetical protein